MDIHEITKYYHSGKNKNKPYIGLIHFLSMMYNNNNNLSSVDIKDSIKTLCNWTKLNWYKNPNDVHNDKRCPLCNDIRHDKMNLHLVYDCNAIGRDRTINWKEQKDFDEKIKFLESIQKTVDWL